jgi:hypothetical protein
MTAHYYSALIWNVYLGTTSIKSFDRDRQAAVECIDQQVSEETA